MKFTLMIQDLDGNDVAQIMEKLSFAAITTNHAPIVANEIRPVPAHQTLPIVGTVSTTGNEGEFDSAGMPWDERIHASTKTKNADGKWKKRKGVDDAVTLAVEAELKGGSPAVQQVQAPIASTLDRLEQTMGVSPNVAAPAGFAAPADVPTGVIANAAPAVNVSAPIAAPAPAAVAPPVTQAPIARDYKGLMQQISNLFHSKSIDPTYPNTIVQRINSGFGVHINTITDVANDARYVDYAWQCLEVDGKAA